MSYFQTITSLGDTYDLSHLEPFKMEFYSKNARKKLILHVTFSNHCFSKKLSDEPTSQHFRIENTHRERTRVFCPIRYSLSKEIPLKSLIERLNNSSCKVHQTSSRRNWCYSIQIENPQGPYHVFFEIRKNREKTQRKRQDLNLVVESAYHQTEEPPSLIGRMGFHVLCTNIYLGKKVSTKR